MRGSWATVGIRTVGRVRRSRDTMSSLQRSPTGPVVLRRVDGHALLANARAMALAGVTTATLAPAGGRILRDDAGAPTGVFIDAAMDVVRRAQPAPTREERQRAVRSAIAACHRYGLTTVAEPGIDDATLDAYADLLERDDFALRVYAMLTAATTRSSRDTLRTGRNEDGSLTGSGCVA